MLSMSVKLSEEKRLNRITYGIKNLTEENIRKLFVPIKADKKAEKESVREVEEDAAGHLDALQIDEDSPISRDGTELPTLEKVRKG